MDDALRHPPVGGPEPAVRRERMIPVTMPGAREFSAHEVVPWMEAKGYAAPGAVEKVLYQDAHDGSYVRLIKMPRGFKSGDEPITHDFDEVIWVLEGYCVNARTGERSEVGSFAAIPAGMNHGPFLYPEGGLFIEFRHYAKR